ncbi:MAG: DUF481 domain-containing protein [Desulfobacteraceae bacterium]|nr:DUF481 domain-containing protein [Desulfobacteraceae bacterium]
MKKTVWILAIVFIAVFFALPVHAESSDPADQPWERFSFKLGGYIADINSSVYLGSDTLGVGAGVDVEEALGLDSSMSVLRAEVSYRFGSSQRHMLGLKYYDFRRSATKTLETEIKWEDKTYPIGTTVDSYVNIGVLKAGYGYAFFQDDRISLAASIGLFITPIEAGISAAGVGSTEESITAPLPVVGMSLDFAITPKLFLKQSLEVFYLEVGDFKGSIAAFNISCEYNFWKNVGFGIGYDVFDLKLEANGSDYPNVDFIGKVEFSYTGLLLYTKIYF